MFSIERSVKVSVEYRAAVLWLQNGTFDLGAAIAAARETDWSGLREKLVRTGDSAASLAYRVEDLGAAASRRHGALPVQARAAVAELMVQMAGAAGESGDHGELSRDQCALLCIANVALVGLEVLTGDDSRFTTPDGNTVVALGMVDSGGDVDRLSIYKVIDAIEEPVYHEALLAGGAIPPTRWSLADAGRPTPRPLRAEVGDLDDLDDVAVQLDQGATLGASWRCWGIDTATVTADHLERGWDRLVDAALDDTSSRLLRGALPQGEAIVAHVDHIASIRGTAHDVARQVRVRELTGRLRSATAFAGPLISAAPATDDDLQAAGTIAEASMRALDADAAVALAPVLARGNLPADARRLIEVATSLFEDGPSAALLADGRSPAAILHATIGRDGDPDSGVRSAVPLAIAWHADPAGVLAEVQSSPTVAAPALMPAIKDAAMWAGLPLTGAALIYGLMDRFLPRSLGEEVRDRIATLLGGDESTIAGDLLAAGGDLAGALALVTTYGVGSSRSPLPIPPVSPGHLASVACAAIRRGDSREALAAKEVVGLKGTRFGLAIAAALQSRALDATGWVPEPLDPAWATIAGLLDGSTTLDMVSRDNRVAAAAYALDILIDGDQATDPAVHDAIIGLRRVDLVGAAGGTAALRDRIAHPWSADAAWLDVIDLAEHQANPSVEVTDRSSAIALEASLFADPSAIRRVGVELLG